MYDVARYGRFAWLLIACLSTLVLVSGCHSPRDTRSVYLPLAVGNRWVYDVVDDTGRGPAVLGVVSRDAEAFSLSESCGYGHIKGSDSLLHLRCRDTILYLLGDVGGRARWSSILSDAPQDSCTQTLLIYRDQTGSKYTSEQIGTVIVGNDTFQNCLRMC